MGQDTDKALHLKVQFPEFLSINGKRAFLVIDPTTIKPLTFFRLFTVSSDFYGLCASDLTEYQKKMKMIYFIGCPIYSTCRLSINIHNLTPEVKPFLTKTGPTPPENDRNFA